VDAWRSEFNEPEIIDSVEILDIAGEPEPVRFHSGETRPHLIPTFGDSSISFRSVKIMLFADVKAFTGLIEAKTGEFVEAFHGGISRLIDKLSNRPVFLNTWGDSFFAVFESTDDALKLALDIRDYFNKKDWSEFIIDGDMEVRISMHAGPVYEEFDPILKKKNFFGRHVNQAARIEPIVLPGSVFVSETVAALIAFGHEEYDFEYAGNLELAKDFGSYPIYMLQRRGYSEGIES
jgi:class 3 adenylate cyclase